MTLQMKTYTGTKTVQATPMTRGAAEALLGRQLGDESTAVGDAGYLVQYDTGYRAWSPVDPFERAYREVATLPDTQDGGIEREIQAKGLTAPRITPADIEANITSEHYFTAWDGAQLAYWGDSDPANPKPEKGAPEKDGPLSLLTFCVLVLKNGFTVTGESACASPENFDAEVGRKIARANAVEKIWPLMGYELRSRLHAQSCVGTGS